MLRNINKLMILKLFIEIPQVQSQIQGISNAFKILPKITMT